LESHAYPVDDPKISMTSIGGGVRNQIIFLCYQKRFPSNNSNSFMAGLIGGARF
jgi:hypothetical protein